MVENRELALVLKLVADQFTSELKKSGGLLGEFNKFISDWKVQLTAAGGALLAIAKSAANYGDELVKASQRMGTTVEDAARLQHAARLSDTDLQGLSKTVGFLSKEMFAASTGNVEAQRTFDRLGISVTTSSGQLKGTTQMLVEMGDKFHLMPEGPEKTALAMLSLGKTGKDVLPLLNSNLREAFQEADRLGLVMSEKDAKAAEHFNDELTKLRGAIRGITNDVGTALIPKFDALAHALTTIVTDARSAAHALGDVLKLNQAEQPNVGVLQPNDGGRRLRILPAPPGADKAVVEKFFPTEADEAHAAFLRELDRYQKGLAQKETEAIAKRTMDDLRLLFAGANSMREEVNNEVERLIEELKADNARAIEMINTDFAGDTPAERQVAAGLRIVAKTQQEVAAREREDLIINEQAWIAYYDQLGGSAEGMYTHKMDLLRAQLAKELELNERQSANLLMAWQNRDSARAAEILATTTKTATQLDTIELNFLRQSILNKNEAGGDFFEGWAAGMRRYVKDTQTGFGMAADMARRTAQMMELGFKNFFFDAMDGKIQSFKDALASLLDFTKQIVSQMASQLIVRGLLTAGTDIGASFALGSHGPVGSVTQAAMGGQVVRRFAMGGPVPGFGNQDSVPALLTPGEVVLSRKDVGDIKGGLSGGGVVIHQYNYTSAQVENRVQQGPDGLTIITQTIKNVVKGMARAGELDRAMGDRYGFSPKPVGR